MAVHDAPDADTGSSTENGKQDSVVAKPLLDDKYGMENIDAIPLAGGMRLGQKYWGQTEQEPSMERSPNFDGT